MYSKFWEMLEIVANTRYYLQTGKKRACNYVKEMHVFPEDGVDRVIKNGSMDAWLEYMEENQVSEVYFNGGLKDLYDEETEQSNPDWKIYCVSEKKNRTTIFTSYMYHIDFEQGWYSSLKEEQKVPHIILSKRWEDTSKDLREELTRHMKYEVKKYPQYDSVFRNSIKVLDGNYTRGEIDDRLGPEYTFILPPTYSQKAQTVMDTLKVTQVFYGMGNWGDGEAPKEMIEELYKQYMLAALWAINEGDK